jgi:hypothetical protein
MSILANSQLINKECKQNLFGNAIFKNLSNTEVHGEDPEWRRVF